MATKICVEVEINSTPLRTVDFVSEQAASRVRETLHKFCSVIYVNGYLHNKKVTGKQIFSKFAAKLALFSTIKKTISLLVYAQIYSL